MAELHRYAPSGALAVLTNLGGRVDYARTIVDELAAADTVVVDHVVPSGEDVYDELYTETY